MTRYGIENHFSDDSKHSFLGIIMKSWLYYMAQKLNCWCCFSLEGGGKMKTINSPDIIAVWGLKFSLFVLYYTYILIPYESLIDRTCFNLTQSCLLYVSANGNISPFFLHHVNTMQNSFVTLYVQFTQHLQPSNSNESCRNNITPNIHTKYPTTFSRLYTLCTFTHNKPVIINFAVYSRRVHMRALCQGYNLINLDANFHRTIFLHSTYSHAWYVIRIRWMEHRKGTIFLEKTENTLATHQKRIDFSLLLLSGLIK